VCCAAIIIVAQQMLIENGKFVLLRELLEVKRLRKNKDGMEDILDWNIQEQFTDIKNKEEAKIKNSGGWIFPKYQYLLDSIAVHEIPLEFDVKARVIETDLLFFVYTVKNQKGTLPRYWFPRSPVYSEYHAPDLFKRIKHDERFANVMAKDLFRMNHEGLIKILAKAKEVIKSEYKRYYFPSDGENILDDF